jgi:hypothetical protein
MGFPRTIAWRRVDVEHGLGVGHIEERNDSVHFHGRELIANQGAGWAVSFRLDAGSDWESEAAEVEVLDRAGTRSIVLVRAEDGAWHLGGTPLAGSEECDDVDIASTPLTNTPPIVRLGLGLGEATDIPVVWVTVPDLEVQVVTQRYERVEPEGGLDLYRFVWPPDGPSYLLMVDEDGIVLDYERFAVQI